MLVLQPFVLRVLVAAVGVAAATAVIPAASAQTASPTPTSSPCAQPTSRGFLVSPTAVERGEPATITVTYSQPCGEPKAHETPVYARAEGESGFRHIATLSTPAARESSATLTVAPSGTTTYSLHADGQGPQTQTVTVSEPTRSATPTPTQTPTRDCRAGAQVTLDRGTIIATGSATVTVREAPNTLVDLFAYTQPSTEYQLVRSGRTNAQGVATFTVRPPANTRLKAAQREEDCTDPVFGTEPSVVLNVRTALTLTASRNGVRDYTFAGDSLPARPGGLIVSLYRVTDAGSQVLTAQARASASTGDWTINRTFAGTGRFGFVARTGQDLQNAPGASNTRSTLIY